MTTYSFKPNANLSEVNWDDPTVWAGGVVPNAPDADVDFPTVTRTGTGDVYASTVDILEHESFSVRSVDLRDTLAVSGSLAISGLLSLESGGIEMSGGTLTAGAIVSSLNDNFGGYGHVVAGTLTNNATIQNAGDLTIDATTLVNNGTLTAGSGTLAINVGNGGFAGFSGGTFGGGALQANPSGTLALNAGGVITSDAATITLNGGTVTSRDPTTGHDVPLTTSLHSVAAGALLDIESGSYHFGQLAIAGTLALSSAAQFDADQLVISPGGHLTAAGSFALPIENEGVIQAGRYYYDFFPGNGGTLVLGGTITGNGSIEILPAHGSPIFHGGISYIGPTLEIAGKVAQDVIFDDAYGTLRLDRPAAFTGAISTSDDIHDNNSIYAAGSADSILLPNVDYSSITGETYAGNASGGTLMLQQANGAITLRFSGSHTLGNFKVLAIPGTLSSDPSSVRITVSGHGIVAAADYNGDSHSDILWQNVNGAVSTWAATGSGTNDVIAQDTYDARVGAGWMAIDSLDFNGDGTADILWRHANGTFAIWDGNRTGFAQSSYVDSSMPASTAIVGAGDFNGDGRDDLLFRRADGSILAETSGGNGLQTSFSFYSHDAISTDWAVEGVADFTGDGKADILWRHANGSLSTWNATTSPSYTGAANFQEDSWDHGSIDRSWHVVGLGDFNGDGRADILWRNDNGAVSVWTSTGSGSFAESQFNASAATNWSVAEVGDFNGDGLADILWRDTAGQISIWHSTGTGWAQNTYSDSSVGTDWTIAAHHFPY